MKWWLLALIPLTAILATEVYNCQWIYGEYSCELISNEEKPIVSDVEVIEAYQEEEFVTLKASNWYDL